MRHIKRFMLTAAFALYGAAVSVGAAPLPEMPEPDRPRPEQPAAPQSDDIRSMKIAFFTDALKLTPDESAKFWPVYNQYWDERRKIGHKRRILFQTIKESKAGEAQLRELVGIAESERKIMAEYIEKFKAVLPVDKVAKVFVSDEDFKNFLLRRAAENQNRGGGAGGRGGGK